MRFLDGSLIVEKFRRYDKAWPRLAEREGTTFGNGGGVFAKKAEESLTPPNRSEGESSIHACKGALSGGQALSSGLPIKSFATSAVLDGQE